MILFDLPVYQFVMSIFPVSMAMTTFMKMITTLGSTIVIVAGILSVAILFKDKKYFKIFVFVNLFGVILNNIIKLVVHRSRPDNTMPLALETSYSFPSGHSMMSVVFYGLVIYYVRKSVKKKWFCNLITVLLFVSILAVGVSRIYLGVHYATDVLAGFVMGVAYLILCVKVLKKYVDVNK